MLFTCSGLPGASLAVGLFTTLQTTSPRRALGRVTGIMTAGEAVGITTGSILTAFAVDHLPLEALLDTQASIYLVAGVLALWLVRPTVG